MDTNDEISIQSDLLFLNAALEAARAEGRDAAHLSARAARATEALGGVASGRPPGEASAVWGRDAGTGLPGLARRPGPASGEAECDPSSEALPLFVRRRRNRPEGPG
jgi:hypothetical protein